MKFTDKLQSASLVVDLKENVLKKPGSHIGSDPIDMFRFRQYFFAMAFKCDDCQDQRCNFIIEASIVEQV